MRRHRKGRKFGAFLAACFLMAAAVTAGDALAGPPPKGGSVEPYKSA